MKNWFIALFTAAAIGTVATASAQQGDVSAGQQLSSTCVACHGADGNSVNPEWPKIAGLDEQYIFTQLQHFQTGEREDPLMSPVVADLSEEDMWNLAAYYAGQAMTVEETDEQLAELGEQIYRGGLADKGVAACMACHGPTGSGIPSAGFPRIGGQHAAYVASALQAYRSGERATDRNRMMRDTAERLSDEEIRAVASYVAGLYRVERD
ncbi:cytochrome c4 [Alkalilimnicola ehrlichii]|uniref:Cytochrome c4 n=1 Tax=Alkalilimnicola ehrlichii TaxID=351052 RepID=A0A3E0WWX6_9GAMM|nr:c-type cytochrome [Alkalilimnicola ehrlichii]RFA30162.1 cytochrome c4 [Alkalilimnicola ehrlichii]RFA37510.1 cytochrome c4 [Alkalilimnicola ehrlichii]